MKNPASTVSIDQMIVSALRDSGPSGCEGDVIKYELGYFAGGSALPLHEYFVYSYRQTEHF